MTQGATIGFVTTSKGRLHHLRQTLPLVMALEPDEVVVVDYACPDGTAAWVESTFPSVEVVRVGDDAGFCLPRARNLGARRVRSDWICFFDADVMIAPGWLGWLRRNLKPGGIYRAGAIGGVALRDVWGTFVCRREDFERCGGFDEVFRGWGGEDDELYERLSAAGVEQRRFPGEYLRSIPHPDAERTRFHPVKYRELQLAINSLYLSAKKHIQSAQAPGRDIPLACRQDLMKTITDTLSAWSPDQSGPMPALHVSIRAGDWDPPGTDVSFNITFEIRP